MLSIVKTRKKVDKFIYQALRDVVKVGGENVLESFEKKFKETRIEGCWKDASSASIMYTDYDLPEDH